MLVIRQKIGEAVRIGDDIEICILRFDGNAVRIGIEAPEEKRIERISKRSEKENTPPRTS